VNRKFIQCNAFLQMVMDPEQPRLGLDLVILSKQWETANMLWLLEE